jgi:lupus La protein
MTSPLPAIRSQVEFYFSVSNLPRDKFLQKVIAEDVDHMVPLSTLLTFNKLKVLTTDLPVLQEAIRGSLVLRLSDDGKKVARRELIAKEDEIIADKRTGHFKVDIKLLFFNIYELSSK